MANLKTVANENSLSYNTNLFEKAVYNHQFMSEKDYPYAFYEAIIPSDWKITWEDKEDLILIVLDGKLSVNGQLVKAAQTVIIPAEQKADLLTDAVESVHALVVKSPVKQKNDHIIIVDHQSKIWELYAENGKRVLHLKNLLLPDITHIGLMQTNYLPGQVTEWHTHKLTHASYVVSGAFMAQTKDDDHELYFAPGSIVVNPEGQVMRHGAPKNSHAEILFIYNDDFNINYLK